jgi:hypothetical protein
MTRGDLMAKYGVLRPDRATRLSCLAMLARGGTSNDDSPSAINVVEEAGGTGATPWSADRQRKSATSQVGNGAVNGSSMRTTSQMAEHFESMMVGRRLFKISTRRSSPHRLNAFPRFV